MSSLVLSPYVPAAVVDSQTYGRRALFLVECFSRVRLPSGPAFSTSLTMESLALASFLGWRELEKSGGPRTSRRGFRVPPSCLQRVRCGTRPALPQQGFLLPFLARVPPSCLQRVLCGTRPALPQQGFLLFLSLEPL